MVDAVQHFFDLPDGPLLTDASITRNEWATNALSEAASIRQLNLFEAVSSGAFSYSLQRQHTYWHQRKVTMFCFS
ncbi:hypothetical protein [Halomonas sp.]|uniref:hypothetical protein n=1 Tax=Halomonas sp. TaxID=1486246 RepID=UPI003F8F7327